MLDADWRLHIHIADVHVAYAWRIVDRAHGGFDFHLSIESGACQIDSSAVSHRCIRRVQRERNMQNGMITILGDARLRSGYLPHAKRAIYQLIYIPESYDTLELQLSIMLVTTQTQLFLITITQKKMFFPGRGVA